MQALAVDWHNAELINATLSTALLRCGWDEMGAITQTTFSTHFKLLNENFWSLNKMSLKDVLYGSIDNKPALVQVMALRRTGDKPLSEPMMASFTGA